MSISDNYSPVKALGDGATDEFTGSWNVIAESYIRVYLESVATGTQVLQTLGVDYTLTFDDSGFTVDFTIGTTPTSSDYVVISRVVEKDQSVPFRTSKGFQGYVHEDALDKLTAICQDLRDDVDRAPKTPVGAAPLVFPTWSAGLIFGWDTVTDGQVTNGTKTVAEVEAAVDAVAGLTAGSGVLVSSNDTTVGFLNGKLVAGSHVVFTENNDGGNETLTVNISQSARTASRVSLFKLL